MTMVRNQSGRNKRFALQQLQPASSRARRARRAQCNRYIATDPRRGNTMTCIMTRNRGADGSDAGRRHVQKEKARVMTDLSNSLARQ